MKDIPSKFYVFWIEFKIKDGSIKNATFAYDFKNGQIVVDPQKCVGKFYYYSDWFDIKNNKPRRMYYGKYAGRSVPTYASYVQSMLEYTRKFFQRKLKAGLSKYSEFESAKIKYGRANSGRVPFKSDVRVIDRYRMNAKTRIGFCSDVLREIPVRSTIK